MASILLLAIISTIFETGSNRFAFWDWFAQFSSWCMNVYYFWQKFLYIQSVCESMNSVQVDSITVKECFCMCLQDSIDLVAGHYQVRPGTPSPLQLSLTESIAVSDTLLFSIQELEECFSGLHSFWNNSRTDSILFLLQLPSAVAAFMAGAYFTSISARQCKAPISP